MDSSAYYLAALQMDLFSLFAWGIVWGFINFAIASTKGRKPWPHFWAAFFLGPIGIIITLCHSNKRAADVSG